MNSRGKQNKLQRIEHAASPRLRRSVTAWTDSHMFVCTGIRPQRAPAGMSALWLMPQAILTLNLSVKDQA